MRSRVGPNMIPLEQPRRRSASNYTMSSWSRAHRPDHLPRLWRPLQEATTARAGTPEICEQCDARRIERTGAQLRGRVPRLLTARGVDEAREVVIRANGYTTDMTPTPSAGCAGWGARANHSTRMPRFVKRLIPKGRRSQRLPRGACYYGNRPTKSGRGSRRTAPHA